MSLISHINWALFMKRLSGRIFRCGCSPSQNHTWLVWSTSKTPCTLQNWNRQKSSSVFSVHGCPHSVFTSRNQLYNLNLPWWLKPIKLSWASSHGEEQVDICFKSHLVLEMFIYSPFNIQTQSLTSESSNKVNTASKFHVNFEMFSCGTLQCG